MAETRRPLLRLTPEHVEHLNTQLRTLDAEQILRWSLITLPHLAQTTALGLSGLVIVDMLAHIAEEQQQQEPPQLRLPVPPAVFVDTLYHFGETLALVDEVQAHYRDLRLHVYRPAGVDSTAEFERQYGERLWETDEALYDYLVKIEPARRAYAELGVQAVLTGRRASQGGLRSSLAVIEVDETGLVKVNPLASWTFAQIEAYVKEHHVPHNWLLAHNYRSIGDWHSTKPVGASDGERDGRWAGRGKTECGLHAGYFEHKAAAEKLLQARERET